MKENYKPNENDKKKMEALLNEARGIISAPPEDLRAIEEEARENFLDNASNVLTNIEKGSIKQIYFQTLMEEMPELYLSFDDEAVDAKGRPLSDYVAVKTIPFKTDRQSLINLRGNWVITFFTNSSFDMANREKFGLKLEKAAMLPKGTTARLLSREYNERLERFPEGKDVFDARYGKYLESRPLSDEEIKEFLQKEIREELKNRE